MADLFVSYSREDSERAAQIAAALEADGFDVFWDKEIPAGQTWADFIENKLNNAHAVVVLWSEVSTKSQWVREEARMGRDKGKLIPVQIDAALPPFGFGEVQAANLTDWAGDRSSTDWQRLVSAIRYAIEKAGQTPPPVRPVPPPAVGPRGFSTPQAAGSVSARQTQDGGVKKRSIPMPVWWIGGICAVLLTLGIIGILAGPDTGEPLAGNDPQQSQAFSSGGGGVVIASPVQAAVDEALANDRAGAQAARQALQNAQTGRQAADAGVRHQGGAGQLQGPDGTVSSGDLNGVMAGRPSFMGLTMPAGIQFYGQYQQLSPADYTMNGAASQGGMSASGFWQYNATSFSFVGQGQIPGRFAVSGREQGASDGSQGAGAGVVTYPDGRRYVGQYRTAGDGPNAQYFMHGLGALYDASGALMQAGRFESDRLVAPQ